MLVMERFEIRNDISLEVFTNFVSKTKETLTLINEEIRNNIKSYEERIEETQREIVETETSREKCEHEISKMEDKIDNIKEAIENVENTYRKMAEAYSSTSKGETKDIYSDILDGAKSNCEKEVEKNRSEIARLNSDIEAIKNNILEFNRIIGGLNKDLSNYKSELDKYNKACEYMEKTSSKVEQDFDDISEERSTSKNKSTSKKTSSKVIEDLVPEEINIRSEEEVKAEPKKEVEELDKDSTDAFPFEVPEIQLEAVPEEPQKSKVVQEIDESLQRIYDLTGYKPKKEEPIEEIKEEPKIEAPKKEEPKVEEHPVYSDNLEDLFKKVNEDARPETSINKYDEQEMSEWERILNSGEDLSNINVPETPVEEPKTVDNPEDTINQLLKPYGTTYARLSKLISNKITHKDGTSIPVDMKVEDVVKAVNSIDGNDLKAMKTVGPEITLLRKVKQMKEGNL